MRQVLIGSEIGERFGPIDVRMRILGPFGIKTQIPKRRRHPFDCRQIPFPIAVGNQIEALLESPVHHDGHRFLVGFREGDAFHFSTKLQLKPFDQRNTNARLVDFNRVLRAGAFA